MNISSGKKFIPGWLAIAKFLVGVTIFLVFLQSCWISFDPDLGWHIRTGQMIIENKAVPNYDEFSFTMPGYAWVDHEWLPDVFLAASYSHNLWFLAIGFFSLISFIPFLFWIARAKKFLDLFPILLGGTVIGQFVAIRPQMISFALFFLVFTLIFKLEKDRKSLFEEKYKFIFPLIFLAWANLHAGFISGLILIFIYIFSKFIYSKISGVSYDKFRKDLSCFIACSLVTLINPYGIKIYQEIFLASSSSLTLSYIGEWRPIFTHTGTDLLLFNLFLSLFLLSLFVYFRKQNPIVIVISLIFLAAGIKSSRLVQFFVIAAMPVISAGADNFLFDLGRRISFSKKIKIFSEVITFLILISIFSLKIISPDQAGSYPAKAVDFLGDYAKNKNEIRVFNDYAWGGYLSLRIPELKLFIDGRMPHWKDGKNSAMEDYVKALFDGEWRDVFEKREINLVLIGKTPKKEPDFFDIFSDIFFLKEETYPGKPELLSDSLAKNGWNIIYEDRVSVLLEKI